MVDFPHLSRNIKTLLLPEVFIPCLTQAYIVVILRLNTIADSKLLMQQILLIRLETSIF